MIKLVGEKEIAKTRGKKSMNTTNDTFFGDFFLVLYVS